MTAWGTFNAGAMIVFMLMADAPPTAGQYVLGALIVLSWIMLGTAAATRAALKQYRD